MSDIINRTPYSICTFMQYFNFYIITLVVLEACVSISMLHICETHFIDMYAEYEKKITAE